MEHISDPLGYFKKLAERKAKEEKAKKKPKKTKSLVSTIEENPREFVPLTEFIVRKATGQDTENLAWYVDDMDLYMELFKYENLDEACREIYETKIAKTKIPVDEEERKEEALKWIKGILNSL